MRTTRTFGALVALALLLLLAGGGVGCHNPPCTSIAPGTPATDLSFTSTHRGYSGPCYPDQHQADLVKLGCCERTDAGWWQCVPPASTCEFRWVSHDSYGGECDGDKAAGDPYGPELCGVWIVDGRVVGVCSECEFD